MQTIINRVAAGTLILLAFACGSGSAKSELDKKKEELEKVKSQQANLAEKQAALG